MLVILLFFIIFCLLLSCNINFGVLISCNINFRLLFSCDITLIFFKLFSAYYFLVMKVIIRVIFTQIVANRDASISNGTNRCINSDFGIFFIERLMSLKINVFKTEKKKYTKKSAFQAKIWGMLLGQLGMGSNNI